MTKTNTSNAKSVYFTVAGIEINVVVFNEHYSLLLEALLKKIFRTVRTIDIEWPDAEAIYKQARTDVKAELSVARDVHTDTLSKSSVLVKSVWYKALSKDCTVVAAKAVVGGKIRTVVHNNTFSSPRAHTLVEKIKEVGYINLSNWR